MAAFRSASAVVLSLVLLAGNAAVCAGWMPTPEARMACCVASDMCPMHKSDSNGAGGKRVVSQADADQCCAASERDNSAPSPTAVALTSPLAVLASPVPFIVPEPPRYPTFWRSVVPSPPADVPKHVLLSVFLV